MAIYKFFHFSLFTFHFSHILSYLSPVFYIIYALFLYFLGLWIFQDADRRGINGYFWCIVCVFFPVGGILIYLLLRPKHIAKACPDCDTMEIKDSVLCYQCPYNYHEKPSFKIYITSLLSGLGESAFMMVKYFFFFTFNDYHERFFILKDKLSEMDRLLKKHYFLKSPVRIARKTEKELNMPYYSLTYGATPYSTLIKILNLIKINDNDIFYDLGSGTGRTVMFVNIHFKIKAVGIEIVSFFVEKSKVITKKLLLENVKFMEKNFFEEDISDGTIFYLNCLTYNPELRNKLCKKMSSLKNGARIITLGYPLTNPGIRLTNMDKFFFSWGWEEVYIQEKYSD